MKHSQPVIVRFNYVVVARPPRRSSRGESIWTRLPSKRNRFVLSAVVAVCCDSTKLVRASFFGSFANAFVGYRSTIFRHHFFRNVISFLILFVIINFVAVSKHLLI